MFKFFYLQLFILIFILTSAMKLAQKPHLDTVRKSEDKTTDDEFDEISLKKQLFQDIFMEQQKDDKLQFGYVCENPVQWEQRFEEKDLSQNRHRGKVKWGNVDGSYGEHYWDLNHK